jgi:hypothetical protein
MRRSYLFANTYLNREGVKEISISILPIVGSRRERGRKRTVMTMDVIMGKYRLKFNRGKIKYQLNNRKVLDRGLVRRRKLWRRS